MPLLALMPLAPLAAPRYWMVLIAVGLYAILETFFVWSMLQGLDSDIAGPLTAGGSWSDVAVRAARYAGVYFVLASGLHWGKRLFVRREPRANID